jgi:hypothetical protein
MSDVLTPFSFPTETPTLVIFAMLAADPTDEHAIRPDMKKALDEYGRCRKPTVGGFMYALLSNDLQQAARRADPYNKLTLTALVFYVINKLPAECHGSERAVDAWIERAKAELAKARPVGTMRAERALRGSDSKSDPRD